MSELETSDRMLRILVIEDHAETASSLALLLELSGHRVSVAADGRTALSLAPSFAPEVVFCDLGLPGGQDGVAVATALRALSTDPRPYQVALSGRDDPATRRHALSSGFDAFLPKPVSRVTLESLLATCLR